MLESMKHARRMGEMNTDAVCIASKGQTVKNWLKN